MADRHIIPIPAANDDGPVVVVEVRHEGPHPLDVQLVGCEGENPYVAKSKIAGISLSFAVFDPFFQSNNVILVN